MTDRDQRPELSALLRERPRLERSAEGLLSLLAAAHEGDLADLKPRLTSGDVDWDGLLEWLQDWPEPPADAASMHAWLRELEDLGRAHVGLSRLGTTGRSDEAAQALSAALERARSALDARTDHALYAAQADEHSIAPWSWIRRGDLERLLVDHDATGDVVRLATRGDLSAADEAIFTRELPKRERLQHAYRALVRSLTETVHVTKWSPGWSLDVARDASELEHAAELLSVHLPHAGGTLSVRHHAEGTWWRYPSGAEELVRYEARAHRWTDPLLGAFETQLEVHQPNPAEDAWHGVASLLRVAHGEGGSRRLEVAQALADALAEGPMSDAIEAAHDAFEQGEDLDPEDELLVSHAFVARLTMSEAAAQLAAHDVDVRPLMDALARADEPHRAHRSACFLVPDDVYDDLAGALPVDEAEWWGHRAAVEGVVPAGAIETALAGLAPPRANEIISDNVIPLFSTRGRGRTTERDEPHQQRPSMKSLTSYPADVSASQTRSRPVTKHGRESNVVAFPFPRVAAAQEFTRLVAASVPRPDLPAEPCPWLDPSRTEAPSPGRVPLVLYDEAHDRGVLAELRVFVAESARESEAWAGAPMLERIARETIRDAYRAAASCTANRTAPHPFAAHRLELVVDRRVADGARLSVDGSSVGLSAALAFASAWLERPIAPGVIPLGTVSRSGRVGAVGAVPQKASALPAHVTFIVSKANSAELSGASIPVEQLGEALAAAGLDLSAYSVAPQSEKARLKALQELIEIAELGNLQELGEQARWTDVGDRIRDIVDTFGGESPHKAELSRARVMAALAYSHAGMLADVTEMLHSADREACKSLETRTLFDIVMLGDLIDRQALEIGEARTVIERLESSLHELESATHMLGRALGTLGRAHMHRGDLERALPYLADAVRAHAEHQPHELARSRVYYAMALRMSSEAEDALDQLVRAQLELETLTRAYSPEYEASCRIYLEYELARTLVALERYEEALVPATNALADCEWQPWPQLGLFRVRAWAYRMLGQDELAAADVERMREVGRWLGPHLASLVARLIEEAEGYPVEGGEVY